MKRLLSFFILILFVIIYFQWNGIENKKDTYNINVKRINQEKANLIFDEVLKVKISEADKLSADTKMKIITSFDSEYENRKDELEQELTKAISEEYTDVSPALDLIGQIIEGVTLNNIQGNAADNNDLIIWAKDTIVTDLSLNCATGSRVRSIEAEKAQQFSKNLAYNAMIDITKRGRPFTLWHFLPVRKDLPWYSDVLNYSSTDIRDLRELYLKYNADERILEGFEMLVSNRIYEHEDYFNNRVATPSGILQDKHLQLIVTSGFNIIDQINKVPEYKERLKVLNESITHEEATYLKYERYHYMQIFIYGILMLLLFLHVNVYMENKGKNNTNTGKSR